MKKSQWFKSLNAWLRFAGMLAVVFGLGAATIWAQMNGAGSVNGLISDTTGAYVPGATVTATDVATGVKTVRKSTSSGYYVLSPLSPGTYDVSVSAQGFETLIQKNIIVDALQVVGLNLRLHVGEVSQSVTVTSAPPALDTVNATVGGTIENQMYTALPLEMNGGARNPTAFIYLMPGVSQGMGNPNTGVFNGLGSGGGNDELYIDGVPTTRASVQGDPRNVSDSIGVDAVDQFQVVTAGSPVEYSGLGTQNYVIKSGTNQIHGSVFEYLRNTALDTWGWGAPAVKNPATGKATKPPEHQNEFGFAVGGPFVKNRIFYFGDYDGYGLSEQKNPSLVTIPTMAERTGNFADLLPSIPVYDPATTVCNPYCSRSQADYNGVLNQLPPSEVSSISSLFLHNMPAPSNSATTNNYLAPYPVSSFAWKALGKVDAVLNNKQHVSAMFSDSRSYPHSYTLQYPSLPVPWGAGQIAVPHTENLILEHDYVLTKNLVNQLKGGVVRYIDSIGNADYTPAYGAATHFGITGLPGGQTNDTFPWVDFAAGAREPTPWDYNGKAYRETTTTYDLVDNLQYVRGKHSLIFGGTRQWLQDNYSGGPGGYITGNGPLVLIYTYLETAGYFPASAGPYHGIAMPGTGDPFASFLTGQVYEGEFQTSSIFDNYGRMRTMALYGEDNYRVTPKLSLNLGLRWDWFPPFYEAQNRMSWLNPTMTNPAVNYPGALQFAGGGTNGCNCKTYVKDWLKNFAPRIGIAYAANKKTVLHFGFTMNYGRDTGASNIGRQGSGGLGFVAVPTPIGNGNGIPAFVLNGKNTSFPAYQAPPFISAGFGAGNYTGATSSAQSITYADPYYGSRNPYSINWNFGVQRYLVANIVINVNYVGNQGHFLAPASSGARGIWADELNPEYLNLKSLLTAKATASNIAAAQAIDPGITVPYSTFSTSATIEQMLRPFPQYSGVSDAFGDVVNSNYNSLQLTLRKRMSQGLDFMLNYTYGHEIDNQGTYRSGYYPTRAERGRGAQDTPQLVAGTAVWNLPFGQGHALGGGNRLTRALTSDWEASGIFTYNAGFPLQITATNCTPTQYIGQCMPNYVPGFTSPVRLNGSWGHGALAGLPSSSYIAKGAFADPAAYTIGNLARTGAYGLRGPGTYDINMSVKRSFKLYEKVRLLLDVSGYNLTNKVLFGISSTNMDSTSFGQVSGQTNTSRDIQLAARVNF